MKPPTQPVQISVTLVALLTVPIVAPSGMSPPETRIPTSAGFWKFAVADVTVALPTLVLPSVTVRPRSLLTRTFAATLFVQLPVAGPGLAGHSGPPARVALLKVTVMTLVQPVPLAPRS